MTKLEFLAALRTACEALPPEITEAALADYERQFTDQFLSGQSEQRIVDRWGSPSHAALKLKLGTLNGNLKQAVSVEKVARVGISGVGLALMDFFLLIPATIYLVVLTAFYTVSLAVYLSGIFVSASSLAGVNYIDVPTPTLFEHVNLKGSTRLNIGSVDIVPTDLTVLAEDKKNPAEAEPVPAHFLRDRGLHIATHINKNSLWKGISTTLAGMLMLVLCLLATRYSFRVLRQFAVWHFAVLKNA